MRLARLCLLFCPLFALTAQAQLGSAAMFGVLGASTVTSTGNTVIDGDLGVRPGSAITEPSSIMLFSTRLLGLAGFVRGKLF